MWIRNIPVKDDFHEREYVKFIYLNCVINICQKKDHRSYIKKIKPEK